eukprot:scaffold2327_cov112-Skeletonema_dohrnii-CCMP3373.AAC.8
MWGDGGWKAVLPIACISSSGARIIMALLSSIISFDKICYYALLDLLFIVNSRCRRLRCHVHDVCHVDVPDAFDHQAQRSKIQGSRHLATPVQIPSLKKPDHFLDHTLLSVLGELALLGIHSRQYLP